MEYNDNFVLPPEEVLKKMRVEYQNQSIKVNTNKVDAINKNDKMILSQNAMFEMQNFIHFTELVLKQNNVFLLSQKCSTILILLRKNIKQLNKLYPNVTIKNFKKQNFNILNNKIKQLLLYENKTIKNLIELYSIEQKENSKIISQILKEHIKITHSLICEI